MRFRICTQYTCRVMASRKLWALQQCHNRPPNQLLSLTPTSYSCTIFRQIDNLGETKIRLIGSRQKYLAWQHQPIDLTWSHLESDTSLSQKSLEIWTHSQKFKSCVAKSIVRSPNVTSASASATFGLERSDDSHFFSLYWHQSLDLGALEKNTVASYRRC